MMIATAAPILLDRAISSPMASAAATNGECCAAYKVESRAPKSLSLSLGFCCVAFPKLADAKAMKTTRVERTEEALAFIRDEISYHWKGRESEVVPYGSCSMYSNCIALTLTLQFNSTAALNCTDS